MAHGPWIDIRKPKRLPCPVSNDSVTVTSSQSWFGRIGGAIVGGLIGVFLFLAAFPLLVWNEGNAINTAKRLDQGSRIVVSIPDAPVEPANNGKLVHVSGRTSAQEPVSDPLFGVSAPAIKLRRDVEMYQWTEEQKSETRKKLGGGEETVTTYSYQKKWSSSLVDSAQFREPTGHANPEEMPVESETFVAGDVMVGAFHLPDGLVGMINNFQALSLREKGGVTASFSAPITLSNGGYYVGENPQKPAVGDLRIRFQTVNPGPVSIVAGQVQDSFEPYAMEKLGSIELLQTGTVSAEAMFESEKQSNILLTWLLRGGGFLMMFVGLALVTRPLSVLADVVPFIGNIVGAGLGVMALIIALPLTIGTVAIAWVAYRPWLGIPLLVIALVSFIFGVRVWRRKKGAKIAAA